MKKLGLFIMPLMAISLLASCGCSKPRVDHFVTFECYGGEHVPTQRVKDGKTATEPTPKPTRGKDEFLGWFTDFDKPSYTFKEKVTDDITLYAGWKVAPDPETTCSFKFTGEHCSINGYKDEPFEITLPKGTQTQFKINPDDGYLLPTDDETHFNVIKGSIDKYDSATGLIKIGNMSGDIEIEAKSEPAPPVPGTTYTITFDCTNCKALDEKDNEITTVDITLASPYTTYHKFYLDGKGLYKKPLESLIKVERTNKNEEIDFKYDPLTGEIEIPIVDDLTITASGINKTLEECTWEEINEISTTKRATEFFYVGEEKDVKLKNQTFSHTVRIIGFNHDYSKLPDEGDPDPNDVLGITFEFKNLIADGTSSPEDTYKSIWDDSNNYDYRDSALNKALNNETSGYDSVINRFPKNLRDVIKPVDKKVGVRGEYGYTATSFDGEDYPYPYLFSLAYDEITIETGSEFVTPNEGKPYQYYIDHTEEGYRHKTKPEIESQFGEEYYLRSPYIMEDDRPWLIAGGGELDFNYNVDTSLTVAPAFCI